MIAVKDVCQNQMLHEITQCTGEVTESRQEEYRKTTEKIYT